MKAFFGKQILVAEADSVILSPLMEDDPIKEKESFRPDDETAEMIRDALVATGWDKSRLYNEALRLGLPIVSARAETDRRPAVERMNQRLRDSGPEYRINSKSASDSARAAKKAAGEK
jgi:hypothetical protein